jgi:hypothetical protein
MTPWATAGSKPGATQVSRRESAAVRRGGWELAGVIPDVFVDLLPVWFYLIMLIGLIGWWFARPFRRAEVVQ